MEKIAEHNYFLRLEQNGNQVGVRLYNELGPVDIFRSFWTNEIPSIEIRDVVITEVNRLSDVGFKIEFVVCSKEKVDVWDSGEEFKEQRKKTCFVKDRGLVFD